MTDDSDSRSNSKWEFEQEHGMKLNEKTVVNFAVCSSPIDKEGYLHKRGELNKGFQRRWFVLKGNLMFYFEKKQDKEPLGVVVLENCSVQASAVEKNSFEIIFEGVGSRTYILQADNEEEMTSWMKSIAHASYEYIRTIVTELQRQLDSLTMESTSTVAKKDSQLISLDSPTNGMSKLPSTEGATSLIDETSEVPPRIPKKKKKSSLSALTHSSDEYLQPTTWKMNEVGKSQSLCDDSAFLSGQYPPGIDDPGYIPPFPIPEDLELTPSPPSGHTLSPSPTLDPTPVMSTTLNSSSYPPPSSEFLISLEQNAPSRQRSKVVVASDNPNSFYHMHQELGEALKVLNPQAAEKLPPLPPKPQS